MNTVTAPTAEELNSKAIDRIIEQAKRLKNDSELDIWRDVYEPAKWAIAEFELSSDSYSTAIRRLSEALKI